MVASRKSILCPNCRKLISTDEPRCPYCSIKTPGSRLRNNPFTRSWGQEDQIVRWVIIANFVMFIFSLVISKGGASSGFNPLQMFSPSYDGIRELGATGRLMVDRSGWWTLLSANYLHGGLIHILFNMTAVYQLGSIITRLYGAYRFFIIFTISGIGGFLVSYIWGVPITVGASAGLFGLIGAAIYYGKSRGGLFGEALYKQIGGWALSIILIGFMFPNFINNSAHIGGMAFGVLSAYLLGYHESEREGGIHRIIAGVCLVATVLVLLWALIRGVKHMF